MNTTSVALSQEVAHLMRYAPLNCLSFADRMALHKAIEGRAVFKKLSPVHQFWISAARQRANTPTSDIIKGGEGSGFHREDGHAGIPGQQGGSRSTGGSDASRLDNPHRGRAGETRGNPKEKPMGGSDASRLQDPHRGRAGERSGGPKEDTPAIKRVWEGKQHEGEATLSKLETGTLGEQAVMDAMSEIYGVPFGTVNVNVNNAPFDVIGDHLGIEVKTGLATNGASAQQWRATIGQPGKAEAELLKSMSSEAKRAHNEWKMQAILDRKHNLLDKMSRDAGAPIKPKTVCLIMAGDGSAADMYSFDGFHLRLPWNKSATDENFLGTYDFKNKRMNWKDGGKPTKAAPDYKESSTNMAAEDLVSQMTGGAGRSNNALQKATLAEIDADFAKVYQWWKESHDPKTGMPKGKPSKAVVKSILNALIKGGEGSGFHREDGHQGIPGQQGGSRSTGGSDASRLDNPHRGRAGERSGGPKEKPTGGLDASRLQDPHRGRAGERSGSPKEDDEKYVKGKALKIDELDIHGKAKREWPMDKHNMNDMMLDSIYRKQGFDGLPEAVDAAQFDALLAKGDIGVELHRGEWNTNKSSAAQTIDEFINGRYTVGKGIIGNGTYASKSQKEAGMSSGRKADGMLRMGLRKEAKVMKYNDLLSHMEKQARSDPYRKNKSISEALTPSEEMEYMNSNPGRVAAFLGYDAIEARDGVNYIILNRTAVYVEKKKR